MNLLLIGGINFSNKEWVESIEKLVKPNFDLTLIQYYKHWETGEKMMDFYRDVAVKVVKILTT